MTIPYDDIKIAHFSGALSLAQWVLDPVLHNTMAFDSDMGMIIIPGALRQQKTKSDSIITACIF